MRYAEICFVDIDGVKLGFIGVVCANSDKASENF